MNFYTPLPRGPADQFFPASLDALTELVHRVGQMSAEQPIYLDHAPDGIKLRLEGRFLSSLVSTLLTSVCLTQGTVEKTATGTTTINSGTLTDVTGSSSTFTLNTAQAVVAVAKIEWDGNAAATPTEKFGAYFVVDTVAQTDFDQIYVLNASQISSGFLVQALSLAAGSHTIKLQAKRLSGAGSIVVGVNTKWALRTLDLSQSSVDPYTGDTTCAPATTCCDASVASAGSLRLTGQAAEFGSLVVSFDGSTAYASVADSADYRPAAALTASVWVYPTSAAAGDYLSFGSTSIGYQLGQNASGQPVASVRTNAGGGTTVTATSAQALALNTWQLVTMTYDGSNVKLYVNGTLVATTAQTGTIDYTGSTGLLIGQGTHGFFRGLMTDAQVYSTAKTIANVQSIFGNGAPNTTLANLVGEWRFGEGTGSSLADLANSHTATLHGSYAWQFTTFPDQLIIWVPQGTLTLTGQVPTISAPTVVPGTTCGGAASISLATTYGPFAWNNTGTGDWFKITNPGAGTYHITSVIVGASALFGSAAAKQGTCGSQSTAFSVTLNADGSHCNSGSVASGDLYVNVSGTGTATSYTVLVDTGVC